MPASGAGGRWFESGRPHLQLLLRFNKAGL
jgi:hypothetical protein